MVEMKSNRCIKKIIINFLYKSSLAMSIVFLLFSVYLNISNYVSDSTILTETDVYAADEQSVISGSFSSMNFHTVPPKLNEIYDEKIAKINNLHDFKRLVDYEIQKHNFEGIDIPIYIDDIVRRKYFHHTAYISADTNWILKGADYFFPEFFFLGAMDPKDLIKKNHGSCSQQSIIFQEFIKDYKFEYASIDLNIKIPNQINFGHFVSAVKVGGDWFYFDSNLEPAYDRKNALIVKKVLEADKEILKKLYPQYNFDLLTKGMIYMKELNRFPAKRGVMFQKITQFLSNFSWLVFLIFSFLLRSTIQKKDREG